jgi:hypothetical protein
VMSLRDAGRDSRYPCGKTPPQTLLQADSTLPLAVDVHLGRRAQLLLGKPAATADPRRVSEELELSVRWRRVVFCGAPLVASAPGYDEVP